MRTSENRTTFLHILHIFFVLSYIFFRSTCFYFFINLMKTVKCGFVEFILQDRNFSSLFFFIFYSWYIREKRGKEVPGPSKKVQGLFCPGTFTPCWSPLVFWNIQCHWMIFPFQNFQFENMKIPFQFQLDFCRLHRQ